MDNVTQFFGDAMEITITQDKLVDLLMHAATRDDIAEVKTELKSDMAELRIEFKTDAVELKRELSNFENRINRNFQKIDSRYNWIIGLTITCTLTIISSLGSIIAHGLHMF